MFNSNAVSAAKACAILLMVIGHSVSPVPLHHFIYTFHVPLFFIMSGYCFKTKYLDDAKTFVVRRITGIWWPYVKWGLIFLLFHNICFYLNIYNDIYGFKGSVSHLYTLEEFLKNGINVFRFAHYEQLLGAYWFLEELFWASLIGYVCIKYLRKFMISGGVILILFFFFAYMGNYYRVYVLGWTARTWMATFFFLFGHAWRENEEKGGLTARFDKLCISSQIFIVIVLAVVAKGCQLVTGFAEMMSFTINQAPLFMVGAICGSMMMTYICRWIVSAPNSVATRFLTFTGRHTLEILTWHFLCFKLVSLVIIAVYGLKIERLATFAIISTADLQEDGVDIAWSFWWVAYMIVGAGIPILWQYLRFRGGKEVRKY